MGRTRSFAGANKAPDGVIGEIVDKAVLLSSSHFVALCEALPLLERVTRRLGSRFRGNDRKIYCAQIWP